jgi:alpha-beta hydrolase superfamily lysophospholipase
MPQPPAARPLPLVPRWIVVTIAALVALGLAALAGRWYVGRRAARELIVPAPGDTTTPQSVRINYADLQIPSGDHTIRAWWVRAPARDSAPAAPTPPAVLLFHANRSSLSEQVGVQQMLYRAGISSLAFDYSGFGASAGTPSPAALRRDARAAFLVFADSARTASRRVLLGTSLGAAVLLDAVTDLQAGADGIVLVGVFASAREAAVRSGRAPRLLAWLLPDLYDNVAAVRRVTRPLLLVHSAQDEVFPVADAERLLEAAAGPKKLLRLDHGAHAAYLSTAAEWAPVIVFIKQGLDSTS